MDWQLAFSITAAKLTKKILRLSGSGGTAAPGLVAQYFDKSVLKKLAQAYPNIVLITGTNGKTTTARILAHILSQAKISCVDNREGSNLVRGLIASLVEEASIFPKDRASFAIFEVDEAALPAILKEINPLAIIFSNLFRDQLDRYGEVETIRKMWLHSVQNLDKQTTLFLNADDPAIASLASETRAKIVFYGLEDENINLGKIPHASDYTSCTNCGSVLFYKRVYLSHLGLWGCTKCSLKRPKPLFSSQKVVDVSIKGSTIELMLAKEVLRVNLPIPGLYNVYNALSAAAVAKWLNIDEKVIKDSLEGFKPAFGRTEKVSSNGRKLYLSLVKNPTGFNEVIRTVFSTGEKRIVLIIINDLIADGRDVSWLWDVDFENMLGKTKKVFLAGTRAADMQLRLKYAQVENYQKCETVEEALNQTLKFSESGETIFIFPTYTAMLNLKSILAKKGLGVQFWED